MAYSGNCSAFGMGWRSVAKENRARRWLDNGVVQCEDKRDWRGKVIGMKIEIKVKKCKSCKSCIQGQINHSEMYGVFRRKRGKNYLRRCFFELISFFIRLAFDAHP
jgi:hypothetical protein